MGESMRVKFELNEVDYGQEREVINIRGVKFELNEGISD